MAQKVAVLLVHGIERHTLDDMELLANKTAMIDALKVEFRKRVPVIAPDDALSFVPCIWPVEAGLQARTLDFMTLMETSGVKMGLLREFLLDVVFTGAAYQSRLYDRQMYGEIHASLALAIGQLRQAAGEQAPLVVVAHSIGSLIAFQYFYDLQWHSETRSLITPNLRGVIGSTPIERGHTLAALFTLGSPLALWAMRFENYGTPVIVPAPEAKNYHPRLEGQWVNFYDKDDVLAYPLQPLSAEYEKWVKDQAVNVGGLMDSWNPASHFAYWTDADVIQPIAAALANTWRAVNGASA